MTNFLILRVAAYKASYEKVEYPLKLDKTRCQVNKSKCRCETKQNTNVGFTGFSRFKKDVDDLLDAMVTLQRSEAMDRKIKVFLNLKFGECQKFPIVQEIVESQSNRLWID